MSDPTPEPPQLRYGLRFFKLDLHVHSPASKDFMDLGVTPEGLVAAAKTAGLDGIAITDHNSGAWIDEAQKAGKKAEVVIFPGVEISCAGGKSGIHVVALFDPSKSKADIEGLLSELGLKPERFGDLNAIVQKDLSEVARIVNSRGGLAVWAHANSSHGILSDMSGQPRILAVQCPHVSAIEGTDFEDAAKKASRKRVTDLMDGSDPSYRRKLAVYQSSDNPSGTPSGGHGLKGIGSRYSHFKLDRIDLNGLRQCFADPDVRIRQGSDISTTAYPRIKSIRIQGGFLDKAEASFHEGLNSVLGAKGAGKSLLVEFLRFGLDQPPSQPDIKDDHDGKLHERLQDYGKVEVTFSDETGNDSAVKRTYDVAEGHPYEDSDHPGLASAFPVLFLSQNEIIKIAEDPEEQIAFIDLFFDFRAFRTDIARWEKELAQRDAEFSESARAFSEVQKLEKEISSRTNAIKPLEASLKSPVFDEFTQAEGVERAFRDHERFLQDATNALQAEAKLQGNSPIPTLPDAVKEEPRVKRIQEIAKRTKNELLGHLASAAEALSKGIAELARERVTWTPAFQAAKKKYDEVVQKEGGDRRALAQKRAQAVKELESLQIARSKLATQSDRLKTLSERRQDAVAKLRDVYDQYSKERATRCAAIEAECSGRLRIRITESSNVSEFKRRLGELKKGSHLKDLEIERLCDRVEPGEFAISAIRYAMTSNPKYLESIVSKSGVDLARVQLLAEFLAERHQYEELLSLEYKAVPQDHPEITFNVGGGKFEPLERLSVGQKCTAMLMIAMTEGRMPIVIDQPEDSLDIRSIWDDICLKLRKGKERRQFIFTTHNSSVAVASDTDRFIILEGNADQGRVMFSGSMDHEPVSEEVIKYLEGGIETYRSKFGKYRGDLIVG